MRLVGPQDPGTSGAIGLCALRDLSRRGQVTANEKGEVALLLDFCASD